MADKVFGHVTVEKTGKWIKFQQLLAWLAMLGGAGLWLAGATEPGAAAATETTKNAYMTMGGAAAWMVVLRVLRWWHHD